MKKSNTLFSWQQLIVFVLLTISSNAFAEKYLVISESRHPYHQKIVESLSSNLMSDGHVIDSIIPEDFSTYSIGEYSSLITIGYQSAARVINNQTAKPVLSLLIPKLAFNLLLNNKIEKDNRYLFSSIYIDQPIERQLRLIDLLSHNFKKIGILYGKNSYSRKKEISSVIASAGYRVKNITVLERTELISETRHLSENSDLLLAIPDSTIYNRRSIKGILLTTYRNKIPVIGFSKAYVKAGALAAVYSSPENISLQAIETIQHNTRHSYISASRQHPKYFNIETNAKVARSLNINIPNKDQLLKQLIKFEANQHTQAATRKDKHNRG